MEKRTIDPSLDAFSDFPPELAEMFRNARPVTQEMVDEIAATNRALGDDPDFMADLLKGYFVECILEGLEETGLSKAQLAKRIGKTRQYINKVLNEDKRVNFTIESMVKIAHALGRKVDLHVLKKNEEAHIFRTVDHREVRPVFQRVDFPGSRTIRPTFASGDLKAV